MKTNYMKTMTNLAIWDVHLADDEIRIWFPWCIPNQRSTSQAQTALSPTSCSR